MVKELRSLGWDYVMFFLFIAITVLTPLWKRLFRATKKNQSKADYVFATGGISIIAIMLSIARGTLGVRSVLGYPSELFYRGTAMWETIYGMVLSYPIVCFVIIPVYFNLGITSVYQYIDLRFKSRLVRCLASATYILRQICALGITVYTPSVALSTVIGIPYWVSIVAMSAICIGFTLLGGLKAAINADVIQTLTVIVVTMAVIIKGTITTGGPKRVYDINRDNGRLNFFNFTGDFTVRVDTTSAILGQLFMSLSQFGCQQNFMQRYVSLKSLREVKKAMMSNIPIIFAFFSISWVSGLVVYSNYYDCDPYAEGYIKKPDEILPFYVEDQLAFIPGFVGIFMATLFNGALCLMVSNLSSLSTVIWEDFLAHLPQFKGFSDKQQLGIIKINNVIFGSIIMFVAFGVGLLSGVIESSMLAFSATSGPLLGCFILAMLVPIANWKGTSAGMISSFIFVLWIIFGSLTVDKSAANAFLPTSTEGCSNRTFSQGIYKPGNDISWLLLHTPSAELVDKNETLLNMMQTTPASTMNERTNLETFYSISYMYYSLIGTGLTILIGIIVSYFTQSPKDSYNAKLLHPLIFKWSERFPGQKPYYIKELLSDITTTAGGGSNINTSMVNGDNSKINHAFESQNETTPTSKEEKLKKKPLDEVVFTVAPLSALPVTINSSIQQHVDIDAGVYRKMELA